MNVLSVSLLIASLPSVAAFLPNNALAAKQKEQAAPLMLILSPVSESSVLLSSTETATATVDPLSTSDIGVGIVMALVLVALAIFLQEQSSSSFPNMVLWVRDMKDEQEEEKLLAQAQAKMDREVQELLEEKALEGSNATTTLLASNSSSLNNSTTTTTSKVDWDEMSRPENYIWYSNPNLRANESPRVKAKVTSDNRLAFLGLVLIFVPIFGAELFLALSRQFLCEYGGSTVLGNVMPWAQDLCTPIYRGGM